MKPWEKYQQGPWAKYQAPPEPEGGSIADPLAQGLTLGFGDEIAGALGAIPASFQTGQSIPEAYRGIRDAARQNASAFSERNPGTSLAANVGGGLLTGGVGLAKTGVQTLGQLSRAGAGIGGVGGIGASEADDFAADATVGMGLGAAFGSGLPAVGRQIGRFKNQITQNAAPSPEYQRAVSVLQDEGVPLTSGQQTASNWQKALERQLAEQPLGGTPLQRTFEDQRRSVQRGLLERVGVEGEEAITPQVLSAAKSQLSERYSEALDGLTLNMRDPELIENVALIRQTFDDLPKSLRKSKINNWIDDVTEEIGKGEISGNRYQLLRSNLEDAANTSKRNEHSRILRALKGSLDQAVERTMPDTMGPLNAQHAQIKTLEQVALNQGGAEAAEGLIPLASLNRAAKKSRAPAEFKQLINSAATVLPDRVPNSGTAQRAAMQTMLQGGGGVGVGGLLGGPIGAALGGLAPSATTNVLARQLAKRKIDVTGLLPGGQLLNSPVGASPSGVAGLLSPELRALLEGRPQ